MGINETLKKPINISLQKLIFGLIIAILAGSTIYFYIKYSETNKALVEEKTELQKEDLNQKVVNFTYLFIEDVLKANGEVDFETRLKLETAVRDLNDKEILAQWQKFTGSQTEEGAQTELKNLLEMLVQKIEVKQ